MSIPENTERKQGKQTFKPGQSGNPSGRPKGSRNKATLTMETLLDGEADAITRKAIEKALGGDPAALRLCMERIAPARRDRPIQFDFPKIETTSDAAKASAALVAAVARGDLTPSEASELGKLLESYVRTLEATDLEDRLARLERMTSQ